MGVLGGLSANEESLALGFFLSSFVTSGQEFNSTRGLLENIMPTLSTAHVESPVFLAFSAVATRMYSRWQRGSIEPSSLAKVRLIQALERLQAALQDPVESKTHATLVATLLLQFQDNVASVGRLHKVPRTHQNGALALARHQGQAGFDTANAKYLAFRLINMEVSSAIREGRPVPADLYSWCGSNDMPRTQSSDLDTIGINVAEMQRIFAQTWRHHSRCTISSCPHLGILAGVCTQAMAAEQDLNSWASGVPPSWSPFKLDLGRLRPQKASPPIQTYSGACDIYPTIQISSLWNSWRIYRLIIQTILLACVEALELARAPESLPFTAQSIESSRIRVDIRNTVDSICASVPFHVGNRVSRCSLDDFTDTSLHLPAYHFLLDQRKRTGCDGLPDHMKTTRIMPRDEHTRHAIAQGPWHIINTLSRILSLCLGPAGASLAFAMRERQLGWVQAQILRCLTILGLDRDSFDPEDLLTADHCRLLSNNLSATLGSR
ncbi:uncharacterized protein A1O9_01987 [Exophiala aquamarina CBS 119918]|uniref:Transcription factor domain-containing protein n=1 Tax=Exophiala aquamarina CBS 119918 TaxID=1182545 RepID=A0A072PKM0_9EURO|nr:uncharacterized protein A1O9_01987 [Exophiala aquamarina CBS 119918]KEF60426.1 hypothetical protein A1O9_01987 [Exophiala aquamarina CBS 119918]